MLDLHFIKLHIYTGTYVVSYTLLKIKYFCNILMIVAVCCCFLLFCYQFSSFPSILFLFSRGLDLSPYVVNEDYLQPIHDLFAMSNHFGGMGGGHCKPHPQHTYYVNNINLFVIRYCFQQEQGNREVVFL